MDSRQASPNARRGKSFFLHFETVPDRFDANLIESLARFPAGGIQLEMGIQTLNASVGERISRKVDRKTAENNIRELKKASGVHIHADLIAGLPGESVEGFAQSFNLLRDMQPDEIQIGILKLLPGAPIARYRQVFQMVFSPKPPYEVIQTDRISFFQMQEMKRFARYYDIFVNPGRFLKTMNQLMAPASSAFRAFADFSNWLWTTLGREYAISLARQYELVLEYNRQVLGHDEKGVGAVLVEDYLRKGVARHLPVCLQPYLAGLQRP